MGDIMARRLATEYTKVMLEVTSSQLQHFAQLFLQLDSKTQIKVCDNGDTEITIYDLNEVIPLSFKNIGDRFELEGSYRIMDVGLAAIMRNAMKQLKGYAVVQRVYSGFIMVYYYENGTVVKIVEKSIKRERVIYEYYNFNKELEWAFRKREAESEIHEIKDQINQLLDERFSTQEVDTIDTRLKELSHQLFVLEA
jgi:hypothetical protein